MACVHLGSRETVWSFTGEPDALGARSTLIEGSSFCISSLQGDIRSNQSEGLFVRDTRILSRLSLLIDGQQPELLKSSIPDPMRAHYILRIPDQYSSGTALLIQRERYLCNGMREHITVRNLGRVATVRRIHIGVAADFADLFAVKENRHIPTDELVTGIEANKWRSVWPRFERGVTVTFDSESVASVTHEGADFMAVISAGAAITITVAIHATLGREILPHEFAQTPARRLVEQRRNHPHKVLSDDVQFLRMLEQARREIDSLQMIDQEHPEDIVLAAGAPWFMALFGRDSIISSLFLIAQRPELGVSTARTLARLQGNKVDPITEEEPGKILHETRFGVGADLALGGRSIYYGSVDSTPLFAWLVSELIKWQAITNEQIGQLLPAVDAALEWCRNYGDRDGDGFIEYQRATDKGLVNQGWKDSWDGVTFSTGEIATPPIALAEVQGYYYAALNGRVQIAKRLGENGEDFQQQAYALKARFDRHFWIEELGQFALGLDHKKDQIDSLTSNLGHLLWTGIVLPERAEQIKERLTSTSLRARWGIRTLATSMSAYNPLSYHNGSIWPHDTVIAASGLSKYGFHNEAIVIIRGLIDAASALNSRLPELLAGFSSDDFDEPVPYPTSCSPQAWSAASASELLRCIAGVEIHNDKLICNPHLPEGMTFLSADFYFNREAFRVTVPTNNPTS